MRIRTNQEISSYLTNRQKELNERYSKIRNRQREFRRIASKRPLIDLEEAENNFLDKEYSEVAEEIAILKSIEMKISILPALEKSLKENKS